MLFGSRPNKLASGVRRLLTDGAVGSAEPGFNVDFLSNEYRAAGSSQSLATALTHSRSGNATMADGYGPELVANGTFDSGSGWTLDTGWTIADGKAEKAAGTGSGAAQSIVLKEGVAYLVSYDVIRAAGGVQAQFTGGATVALASKTASGSYTDVLVAVSGNTQLRMFASSTFAGSIDNISVREMPVLKWAPHNLLTYSEDFSNAAWNIAQAGITVVSNVVEAPDGNLTADKLEETATTDHHRKGAVASESGTNRRFSFYAKAAERQFARCWSFGGGNTSAAPFDLLNGTVGSNSLNATIEDVGNGWYKCEVDVDKPHSTVVVGPSNSLSTGTNTYAGTAGSGIYIWGAHLYRSDLGGMVDNPERGDSYVPTTSAAVYLPRIGHHEFNGYEWVNKGLLAESESRTNLFVESNDLSTQNGVRATLSVDQSISPSGETDAGSVIDTAVAGDHRVDFDAITVVSSTTYTVSFFLKASGINWARINLGTGGFGTAYANFDLSNGSVGTTTGITNAQTEDFGNGYYRCVVTANATSSASTVVSIQLATADNSISYTGDGASGVYLYGAQFEAGSVPSSYVPTSGATATRAAETFTVPAANLPWPQPEVISSELVTNGGFDADSDWTKPAGVAITGGEAVFTAVGNGQNFVQSVGSYPPVVDGTPYLLTFEIKSISAGSLQALVGSRAGAAFNTVGVHQAVVVASSNLAFTGLKCVGVTTAVIDNVSVREINPLSVSIAMKGEMDYADESTTQNVMLAQWFIDSNNRIYWPISTATTFTGRFQPHQANAGTYDNVSTGDVFSPGLNVPFDVASRHGSTFINGAVDGVALTANTTPTALPDLSATDLDLAYDYMGTIESFRVWDQDLGDSGIEEATAPSLEPSLNLTFDGSGLSFTDTGWTP